jgi:hypothetical protein
MAVMGGLSPQKGIAKGARIRGLFAPSKKRRPRRLQIYPKVVKIGIQDRFDLNQEPDLEFFVPMGPVWFLLICRPLRGGGVYPSRFCSVCAENG